MALDALLAVGLLLTTASQFRVSGLPIGPGELCLALWMGAQCVCVTLKRRLVPSAAFLRLGFFWVLFATSMCIGLLTAFLIRDIHDTEWVGHDIVAYIFVGLLSLLCLVESNANQRLVRTSRVLAIVGSLGMLLQLAVAMDHIQLLGLDGWEWDRMRGFSQDANQLAMFCIVTSLLGLHMMEVASDLASRAAAFSLMTLSVITGHLTKSDAFTLALAISVPFYCGLKLRRWALTRSKRASVTDAAIWGTLLSLPVMVTLATPLMLMDEVSPLKDIKLAVKAGSRDGNEHSANLRFQIWRSAFNRAQEAGFLGLGPGPHLPIPDEIAIGRQTSQLQNRNLFSPHLKVADNFEAHNTVFDLLVQGGILVLLAVTWLLGRASATTRQADFDGLTALLCGLVVYSLFHFTLRQPLAWFAIVFCLSARGMPKAAPALRRHTSRRHGRPLAAVR